MFNAREVLLEVWDSNCVKADMDRNPITGTEHDGLCEYCEKVLTKENIALFLHEGVCVGMYKK